VAALVERSAELDATLIDLAGDEALGPLDLLALYLPGLDIAQHALFTGDAGGAIAPSAMAERVNAVEAYYVFLDRALAGLVSHAHEPNNLVMFVAQPGRVAQPGAGLFAMSNAGAVAANSMATLSSSTQSIAPAVLYALGVPLAAGLDDPRTMFTDAFVTAHPMRSIETYGPRRALPRRGGQALDQEMIDRMRSLGYVR
jgi:hypothetical protein